MTWYRHSSGQVTECHISAFDVPVVVIDPANAEQIKRLARLVALHHGHRGRVAKSAERNAYAAALREFATPTPPKPEEPQGLGAVVQDADGRRYVRCAEGRERWHCPDDDTGNHDDYYDQIEAVRVLSEGIS